MLEVARLAPFTNSILDLGIGFGKYGVLCREMLDIEPGRLSPEQWQRRIVGVEGFAQYKNPCWDLYNHVYIEDFTKSYGNFKDYDLVLMIDSLEHVDKPTGHKILDTLLENNKRVLVSCPTGSCYLEQGAVNGNEYERHRAHWTKEDFELRRGRIITEGVCVVATLPGRRN